MMMMKKGERNNTHLSAQSRADVGAPSFFAPAKGSDRLLVGVGWGFLWACFGSNEFVY
jgi:hypothetical protein